MSQRPRSSRGSRDYGRSSHGRSSQRNAYASSRSDYGFSTDDRASRRRREGSSSYARSTAPRRGGIAAWEAPSVTGRARILLLCFAALAAVFFPASGISPSYHGRSVLCHGRGVAHHQL